MKKEKNAVKKPPNGFFLYRREKKDEIMANFGLNKVHHIAAKAGEMWRQEPAHVKSKYQALAYQEFLAFKLKYPDYVWPSPKSKEKKAAQDAAILAAAAAGSSSGPSTSTPSTSAAAAATAAVQQSPSFAFTQPPSQKQQQQQHVLQSPSFAFTQPPHQSPSFAFTNPPTSQIHQSPSFSFTQPPLHQQSPSFPFSHPPAGGFHQSPQFAFTQPPNGIQQNQISPNNSVEAARTSSTPSVVYDSSPQFSLVQSPPQQQFMAFRQTQFAQGSANGSDGGASSQDLSGTLPLMGSNNYLSTGTPQHQLLGSPQPSLYSDFTFPSPYAYFQPVPTNGNQSDLDAWFENITAISNTYFNPQDFAFEIKNDVNGKGFDGAPIQDSAGFGNISNFEGSMLGGGDVNGIVEQTDISSILDSLTSSTIKKDSTE